MGSVWISLLLCLAAALLTDVTCQMKGSTNCLCLKTTNTVVPKENIRDYRRQTAGICHINAIIFTTVKNRKICADPQKPWVREAIEYLDDKRKPIKPTARPVNSTPTYKTTPTVNTTTDSNTTHLLQELVRLKSTKHC